MNWTAQSKQVESGDYISFHTKHAVSPTGRSRVARRVAGQTGTQQPVAEEMGMQPLSTWRGARGQDESWAALFHLERWSQKWQSDTTVIITHGVFASEMKRWANHRYACLITCAGGFVPGLFNSTASKSGLIIIFVLQCYQNISFDSTEPVDTQAWIVKGDFLNSD